MDLTAWKLSEQNFENFTINGRFPPKNAKIAHKISRSCETGKFVKQVGFKPRVKERVSYGYIARQSSQRCYWKMMKRRCVFVVSIANVLIKTYHCTYSTSTVRKSCRSFSVDVRCFFQSVTAWTVQKKANISSTLKYALIRRVMSLTIEFTTTK